MARTIAILCGGEHHPVFGYLEDWGGGMRERGHDVTLSISDSELPSEGDMLFLVSWPRMVRGEILERFDHVLVLHASDLPLGRGWSPHVWDILGGARHLTVSLLEAAEPVDSGDIWAKKRVDLDGSELFDEINEKLFQAELELMTFAVEADSVVPELQRNDIEATYRNKRTPADSELDPGRSIAEQFELLRVCDPDRFPAFFRLRGHTYRIVVEKVRQYDA